MTDFFPTKLCSRIHKSFNQTNKSDTFDFREGLCLNRVTNKVPKYSHHKQIPVAKIEAGPAYLSEWHEQISKRPQKVILRIALGLLKVIKVSAEAPYC